MRKLWTLALLMPLLTSAASQGQQSSPTAAQFTAALKGVISNESQWRKTIELVNIEGLPVDYATGKLFEKNKTLVLENLKMAVLWAARTRKEHSLFAEVEFLSSIQEFESEIQLFVALLNEFDIGGAEAQKRVSDWSTALAALADTVNEAWKTSFSYTTQRASSIDQSCPGATAKQNQGHH